MLIAALFTMTRSEQRVHLQVSDLKNVACTRSGIQLSFKGKEIQVHIPYE
jgi:hypothetical protein